MSALRTIGAVVCLLFASGAALAGGSIPLDEVMEQLAHNDKLIAELDAELKAQSLQAQDVVCVGSRFGNQWEHLGGARAIPYECRLGPRTIEIDGELHLYDENGNELGLEDDDAPLKVVDYKQTNLTWSWH